MSLLLPTPTPPVITGIGRDWIIRARTGDSLVEGNADPGDRIHLNYGNSRLATITADTSGQWSYAIPEDQLLVIIGEGQGKQLSAIAENGFGVLSPASLSAGFNVDTMWGDDQVVIPESTSGAIDTSIGNDWITTSDRQRGGQWTISSGAGDDIVGLSNNGRFHVETGDGDDWVTGSWGSGSPPTPTSRHHGWGGPVGVLGGYVDLGNNNDRLSIWAIDPVQEPQSTLIGGSGIDQLEIDELQVDISLKSDGLITGFERIDIGESFNGRHNINVVILVAILGVIVHAANTKIPALCPIGGSEFVCECIAS